MACGGACADRRSFQCVRVTCAVRVGVLDEVGVGVVEAVGGEAAGALRGEGRRAGSEVVMVVVVAAAAAHHLLPLDHPVARVVEDDDDDVQLHPHRRLELLGIHHEAAVAAERDALARRLDHLGGECGVRRGNVGSELGMWGRMWDRSPWRRSRRGGRRPSSPERCRAARCWARGRGTRARRGSCTCRCRDRGSPTAAARGRWGRR